MGNIYQRLLHSSSYSGGRSITAIASSLPWTTQKSFSPRSSRHPSFFPHPPREGHADALSPHSFPPVCRNGFQRLDTCSRSPRFDCSDREPINRASAVNSRWIGAILRPARNAVPMSHRGNFSQSLSLFLLLFPSPRPKIDKSKPRERHVTRYYIDRTNLSM